MICEAYSKSSPSPCRNAAPKKKKGGADSAEKEEAINKQYSAFKTAYNQTVRA